MDATGGLKQHTLLPIRWACCVEFSPDGKRLAVGTQFANLYVFDTATRERKLYLPDIDSSGNSVGVVYSSDGKTLATFVSGTVKLWDSDTLLLRVSIKAHTEKITKWGLALSPDGKSLATASFDGTVKLWETLTGQERLSFKPPVPPEWNAAPMTIALSPRREHTRDRLWEGVHAARRRAGSSRPQDSRGLG